jgi:hypothetical protein
MRVFEKIKFLKKNRTGFFKKNVNAVLVMAT